MEININNYESYFILYLDDELSQEERLAVDAFVNANPELGQELDMLKQAKLEPDTSFHYPAIDQLYKTDTTIQEDNYETWLLDYIDDELTAEQRTEVEKYISQHPEADSDLKLFSDTKYAPETSVVFPDKKLLYRHEEDEKPVPVIRWWRIAAAAIMIGAVAGSVIWLQPKSEQVIDEPLAIEKINSSGNTSEVASNNIESADQQNANQESATIDENIKTNQSLNTSPKRNVHYTVNNSAEKISPAISNEQISTVAKPNNISHPVVITKQEVPVIETTPLTNTSQINVPSTVTPVNATPLYTVSTTPSTTLITDESEPEKNTKLRGLFRKITRAVEKTTNVDMTDGDDRLLVGALAIKL